MVLFGTICRSQLTAARCALLSASDVSWHQKRVKGEGGDRGGALRELLEVGNSGATLLYKYFKSSWW
jgi:hypothetical protein